jgi:hypothetical protein
LTWGSNFSADYVHDELTSQKVFFPDEAALREEGRTDLVKSVRPDPDARRSPDRPLRRRRRRGAGPRRGLGPVLSRSPFACLLVGQPTLRRRIKLGAFAALDQRIALRYDDATDLIHQTSRGLPRAVNNLAVQSLVAAYADNKNIVDETSARAAITEVTTD